MATLLNSIGHYLPQTSQHQMMPGPSSYPASQMAPQTLLPRVTGVPETGFDTNQVYSQSSLYSMPRQTESLKAPSSLGQHYYVDHLMNPHPYSSLYHGLDINAIRRKNATRETTGPLKAWLKAHRKNPYPTKGEKVMLAISTRMTLTQVSTWFANARRRMKKDKIEDDDDDRESVSDAGQPEKRERSGSMSSGLSHYSTSEADTSKDLSDISDIDIDDSGSKKRPSKKCVQRLFSPDPRTDYMIDSSSSPESIISDRLLSVENNGESRLPAVSEIMPNFMRHTNDKTELVSTAMTNPQKPKIWSISEIIGSASSTLHTDNSSSSSAPYSYNNVPYSDYFSNGQTYTYPSLDSMAFTTYGHSSQLSDYLSSSQRPLQYL